VHRFTPIPAAIGAFVFVLAVTPGAARADDHVVPPGQEDLVGEMLGRGEPIGGCRLVEVEMPPTAIQGTYACDGAGAPVVVFLRYPSPDDRGVFTTTKFVVSTRGEAPPELLEQLRRNIAQYEGEWRWAEQPEIPAAPSPSAQPRAGEDRRAGRHEGLPWLPPAASCAAMLLVLAVDLARKRRPGGRPRPEVPG
jgi:hypothetical protein